MKPITVISSIVAVAAAAADPQITPRADIAARQDGNAVLGWISASGTFSDQRSCDSPATLSSSGSFAQCCTGSSCPFWTSCSAATLFAAQTSLFCDQGYCNTALLVPTVGASAGQSYLGCWATSLGQNPFTIVADIGSAPIASATAGTSASSRATSRPASGTASSGGSSAASASPSGTTPASGASQSSGAAKAAAVVPRTGVFGLTALLFGLL